jgi:hypothetical protein
MAFGPMSDSYDDYEAASSIQDTYCIKHPGMWTHECGCFGKKRINMNEDTDFENYRNIPLNTMAALKRYSDDKIETGGFLRAVLENNLMEALGRADIYNREAIFDICQFIYNEMPAPCHGSKAKVSAWLGE